MAIIKKGYKLLQDKGPIEFKFKESTTEGGDSYTYLNIDGEFYKMKNPDTLTIQLADDSLPNGQLRILVRRSDNDLLDD